MTNPLIEKFEEVYGKKPEKDGIIENIAGAEGKDTISLENSSYTNINPTGVLTIGNSASYISNGYTISSVSSTLPCFRKSFSVPCSTPVEQQFCKVMDDVANNRATVASISADIDRTFTGFGGQIRYTVEIVGTYP